MTRRRHRGTYTGGIPHPGEDATNDGRHIEAYFAQYPSFHFDASVQVTEEFHRLCDQFKWGKNRREQERKKLNEALVLQFNEFFGTNVDKYESWKYLCQILGVTEIPPSISKCRAIIQTIHVNLVDLVEARRLSESVTIFPNVHELRKYTLESDKVFPKNHAKAGGVLKRERERGVF
ncbi:hypothetical protein K474DRAFT_1714010 [Panus rudis PR-1116 ss-1]|nr:hypothetical protein K474DRAFT_1714010 [Panus rudis PR-1116 ss-1]